MVDVQNQQLRKHYGYAELGIAIGKDNFDKVCPVNYGAVIHEREMIWKDFCSFLVSRVSLTRTCDRQCSKTHWEDGQNATCVYRHTRCNGITRHLAEGV